MDGYKALQSARLSRCAHVMCQLRSQAQEMTCCFVSTPHMPGWQALLRLSSLDMVAPGSASTLQTCLLTNLAEDCWSSRLELWY